MAIKVSTLLAHNTDLVLDTSPSLGGALNTNNFGIANGLNPVTISGNGFPTTSGANGEVLTTDGSGTLFWQAGVSGSITLVGDVTGTGMSPVTTVLSNTTVTSGAYGSASSVPVFTVNSQGRITSVNNSPISVTPSAAGLGNVSNSLQVINNGGAPSIQQGTGTPSGSSTLGAIYVDRGVTNGNGIYFYNGAVWAVIASKPNLYNENTASFIAPVAAGTNSVAIGSGAETASSALNSLAVGLHSLARVAGSVVQSNGRFSNNGDAQTGRYLLRGTTTGAASQELLVDGTGGTIRLVLPDNATWTFKITITGHRTDTTDGHAGYTSTGVIYRNSGAATTAVQGSVQKVVLAESNSVWDINVNADTSNGALRVSVTGQTGKIIRWLALVETVEITN